MQPINYTPLPARIINQPQQAVVPIWHFLLPMGVLAGNFGLYYYVNSTYGDVPTIMFFIIGSIYILCILFLIRFFITAFKHPKVKEEKPLIEIRM
jgi:hypothetical protein